MRPVSQVERVGMNLLMCIPPDHMRDDLPSTVSVGDVFDRAKNFKMHPEDAFNTFVFLGVTDDMGNTVTLPCFDVQYVEGKGVVVMAHRTGRPVA